MFNDIRHDLPSSIVVFFVAVPLCLGIALASGAPLFAGIIAGIVGGIVVGMASGSQLGVSGPFVVVVLGIVINYPPNSKVIVDGSKSKSIAYDIIDLIKDYEINAKTKNITVEKINFIDQTKK